MDDTDVPVAGYRQEHVDRGTDHIGLHVYPDPEDALAPAVVIWPAMGVPARYYRPFAELLVAARFAVIVADLRGTGSSTPRPSRASRYGLAELVGDVEAVQEALRPRLADRTTLLLGHSLGGQAALLHLAMSDEPTVDGLVLVAVGLPFFRAYPGRRGAAVLPYTQSIAATSALLRVWPGWGFGGRQAHGVIRDWGYTARHGRYPRLGGIDPERALRSVRTPVLAISVDEDRFTPASTVDYLVGKLPAAPVRREHYAASDRAGDIPVLAAPLGARLDHFAWVRAAGPLADRVATFAAALSN
ncbi:alpha/beta hydrolase family protein [Rugosimonospora africana]|uniref:alpha/beta hydrolase family protein n=1 Tax=Rugosimonospora africana TaxID=556532 RepID=UPI001EF16E31|nr:alpha/beta fold hydrolase [Rugosimonospora africana]